MNAAWPEIDSYVEAFERARATGPVANLAGFAPPSDHDLHVQVLSELVRVDLEVGWSEGRPTPLADYCRDYPAVFANRDRGREIAFEEFRLRRQAGERPERAEYELAGISVAEWPSCSSADLGLLAAENGRFSDGLISAARANAHSREVKGHSSDDAARKSPHIALFRAVYLKDPAAAHRLAKAVQCWPEVGDMFCGFRLLSELGRGAFGRVFLARQGDLADRLVALKVVCDIRGEPQNLARLQHTNIVPVYSVHSAAPFQAICMPFFGGATLDRIIKPPDDSSDVPTPESWAGADPVELALRLAERLSDGLAHAHERGVLHRDLKPANVLITSDGDPMLLDFNLAADASSIGAEALHVGGTLAYMAPELLDALWQGAKAQIDPRSDIYALGLVIWELLAGRHPFARRSGSVREMLPAMVIERGQLPDIRSVNSNVSPAFAAIIGRCLERDPLKRYPSARALQEDLHCQANDRPLRHTTETSWREPVSKWRRRHPRAAVALAAVAILLPLTLFAWSRVSELAQARAAQSLSDFRRDKLLVSTVLNLPDIGPAERADMLRTASLAVERVTGSYFGSLGEGEQAMVRRDAGQLLLLSATANIRAASRAGPSASLDEAWRSNIEAERWLRGTADERALWSQRATIASLRGDTADAERYLERAKSTNSDAPADRYKAIHEAYAAGRVREAIKLIRVALDDSPDQAFLWYALADAHMQLDEFDLAYGYLDASRAIFPDFYRTYYQRGIIELRRGQYTAAKTDFDTALRLSPRFFPALMQRAIARARLGDKVGAIADLDAANDVSGTMLATPPAQIEFMRARLLAECGDQTAAVRARNDAFARPPIDAEDWTVRGLARIDENPKAALSDFDEALKLDSRNRAALRNKANVLAESLGRQAEAVAVLDRLIELSPDSASDLAGRGVVLARLGKRSEALRDAVAALKAGSQPFIRYQVAGIYALTAKSNAADALESIRLLASAFSDGIGLDLVERDGDLDPIRQRSDFHRIVDAARSLRDTSARKMP